MSLPTHLPAIVGALVEFPQDLAAQVQCCTALCALSAVHPAAYSAAWVADAITAVVASMGVHRTAVRLQGPACLALQTLAHRASGQQTYAGAAGAVDAVVAAMATLATEAEWQAHACSTVVSLIAGHPGNQARARAAGALPLVVRAMNCHAAHAPVLQWGCAAVASLLAQDASDLDSELLPEVRAVLTRVVASCGQATGQSWAGGALALLAARLGFDGPADRANGRFEALMQFHTDGGVVGPYLHRECEGVVLAAVHPAGSPLSAAVHACHAWRGAPSAIVSPGATWPAFVTALTVWSSDAVALQFACRCLADAISTDGAAVAAASAGVFPIILTLLETHAVDAALLVQVMRVLAGLTAAVSNIKAAGDAGVVEATVKVLHAHSAVARVQRFACWTLRNLTDPAPGHVANCSTNLKKATTAGAIEFILVVLNTHASDACVAEHAIRALLPFLNQPETQAQAGVAGAVESLVVAMASHRAIPSLQQWASHALFQLTQLDELKVRAVHAGALEAIVLAMAVHVSAPRLQEWCCKTLTHVLGHRLEYGLRAAAAGVQAVLDAALVFPHVVSVRDAAKRAQPHVPPSLAKAQVRRPRAMARSRGRCM